MGSKEKRFDVSFFYEKKLRAFLSKFYFSIVQSSNNAKEIRDISLEDFTPKKISGNWDTKSATQDVFWSLENARIFFKSDDLFESQIMGPLRVAADLRIRFAGLKGGERSTDVEGFVFASSKPYEMNEGRDVTLSLVCPSLHSAMSLRVPENNVARKHGWYEFQKVQPMVLINRLHPTPGAKLITKELQKEKDLLDFGFMFTRIGDLEYFSQSIEMENFTEISSIQSGKIRHLGYPFVSFGRVVFYDEPDMTIESLLDGRQVTVTIAQDSFRKNNSSLTVSDYIEGKTIAFLGVVWYNKGARDDARMDYPELLDLQICENEEIAASSEIIGFARIRNPPSFEFLKKEFGLDEQALQKLIPFLEKSNAVKVENEKVHYVEESAAGQLESAYSDSLKAIRRFRSDVKKPSEPQLTENQLVDQKMTNTKGMGEYLKYYNCKSHDRFGCEILLKMLKAVGSFEEAGNNLAHDDSHLRIFTDSFHDSDEVSRKLWYLTNALDLLERKNKRYSLTKTGKEVLARIREEEAEMFLKKIDKVVDLLQVPTHVHLPTLLTILHNPKNQFSPYEKGSLKTKVYWTRNSLENMELNPDKVERYQEIFDNILSIMRKRSYPLSARKISEELEEIGITVSPLVLEMILDDMIRTRRLEEKESYYEYVMKARIYDFFERNKNGSYSVSDIIRGINMPEIDSDLPRDDNNPHRAYIILKALERSNILVERDSKWTWAANIEEKKSREMDRVIRMCVHSILKKRRVMERSRMESMINGWIRQKMEVSGAILKRKVGDTITEMIKQGEISYDGDVLKVSGSGS